MSLATHRLLSPVYSTRPENSAPREDSLELFRRVAAHAVLLDISQTFGTSFVPDLFLRMAVRPAYLDAAWELFKDAVDLEALDARTRRIVALAITTNRSGTYLITAFPQAFRLSPVGLRKCKTIVSTIQVFQTFDCYLSDLEPPQCQKPETPGTASVPSTRL